MPSRSNPASRLLPRRAARRAAGLCWASLLVCVATFGPDAFAAQDATNLDDLPDTAAPAPAIQAAPGHPAAGKAADGAPVDLDAPAAPAAAPPTIAAPAPAPSRDAGRPAAAPEPAAAGSKERARSFVIDYFARSSLDNPAVLAWLPGVYAPVVEFYGKPIARPALLAQKRAYLLRWPSRSYAVRPGSLEASCNPSGDACTVSGLVEWAAASEERHARASGTARFSLGLSLAGTTPTVVSETGAVVSRNPSP